MENVIILLPFYFKNRVIKLTLKCFLKYVFSPIKGKKFTLVLKWGYVKEFTYILLIF